MQIWLFVIQVSSLTSPENRLNSSVLKVIMVSSSSNRTHKGSGDIILRGHDHSPQGRAAPESTIQYHHQRGGQGQVDQSSVS